MIESRLLSINGKCHRHYFIKKKLSTALPLLAWLKNQPSFPKCYWEDRQKNEVAAVGSVLMLDFVPKFDANSTSPARFWGGHRFFPGQPLKDSEWASFPRCIFFLPQVEISQENGEVYLTINALDEPRFADFSAAYEENSLNKTALDLSRHSPSLEDWKVGILNSLERIESQSFEKVVMARRSTFTSLAELCPFSLLAKIPSTGGTRFIFQFAPDAAFIGSTPERLFKRTRSSLLTEAVAGTRKRGRTPKDDSHLEHELLNNPKEKREFTFVKTSIQESLTPLTTALSCQDDDKVIKTPTVQHLYNPFTAQLKEGVSDAQLLTALHPTAAMGGLPKKSALEYLLKHESFERGWYASPVGYTSQEAAEFVVGIRSALVKEKQIHLFAGTGIVSGSIPEKEWEELDAKISQWKSL